jgi:hypothetical protein
MIAPIWIIGPSLPTGSEEEHVKTSAESLTNKVRIFMIRGRRRPLRAHLTSEMPEPAATGSTFSESLSSKLKKFCDIKGGNSFNEMLKEGQ